MGIESRTLRAVFWATIMTGTSLRLYGITLPLTESHQLRQAQTAMMARNLFYDGMNIFCTRLDFIGSGKNCVIMEFPLMHALSALLYYVFGPYEIIGRLISVAFSIGAMVMMHRLARQFLSPETALWSLALYAFSPMNIFFSRAFMPESSMMFFGIAAIHFSLRWLDTRAHVVYLAGIVCAAIALLVKPTSGVILAPILAAWFDRQRWSMLRRFDFWLYMGLTVIPIASWALYAYHINGLNPDLPPAFAGWLEIVFERGGIIAHWFDAQFYRFLAVSLVLVLLTPIGFVAMIAGALLIPPGKPQRVLLVWLAAVVAYFFVLSGANSGHLYYQLHLLPVAAIVSAYAAERLQSERNLLHRFSHGNWRTASLAVLFLTAVGYGIGYFWFFRYMYDASLRMPYTLEVSRIIRERFPSRPVVITNEPGVATPTVFSYYAEANARRFRVYSDQQAIADLERLRGLGAIAYVALDTRYGNGVNETRRYQGFWRYLNARYSPIAATEHYLIYDLRGD